MKKTLFLIVAMLMVLSMMMVGCAKTEPTAKESSAPESAEQTEVEQPDAETLKIGVIGKSVHPYWSEVQLGAEAAGAEMGVEVQFFVPQTDDPAKQLSTFETFIAQGFNAIAIAPSDPSAMAAGIAKADEMGIPVVTLDTDAPDSARVLYIGTDNAAAGKIAGEKAAELIGNGTGVVIPATGSLTARNSIERIEGFTEGMTAGCDVLEALNDQEDPAKSLSLVEGALSAYDDIQAIFGVYAYNGPAAAQAVKTAGKVGDIKIVSFDTTEDIINWVREGVIDATIGQRPYMMGYESVKALKAIIQDGKDAVLAEYPDAFIDTGVDVVTKDNLDQYKAEMEAKGIPVKW